MKRELVETRWAVRRGKLWEGADNHAETRAVRCLFSTRSWAETIAEDRRARGYEDAHVVRVRIYRVTR